jgi:sulfur-carrier protein adenylyltransferase/sulfurtransferase
MAEVKEMELTKSELERYSRQIVLGEVGIEGQKKLKAASVLIVGAGGLGSPLALYLAAAGVGIIGIIDFDAVSYSNLQRQVLFTGEDVGLPKAKIAKEKLYAINPSVNVIAYDEKLSSANALEIIRQYDIVADGSDNFAAKYLVNDACVMLGKPFVYGSILRFEGQVSFFDAKTGPCYRCLFPEPPGAGEMPSCAEAGVIGVLPGIVGSIQANEVIKFILGIGKLLNGRLLRLDALNMQFSELEFTKDCNCAVCSERPDITELIDYEEFCETKPTENKLNHNEWEITAEELKEKMDSGAEYVLIDVREPYESEICSIGGELIPINSLPYKLEEIPGGKDAELIVYCRTGHRSQYAVEFLRDKAGFKKVKNLIGGIYAWSDKIDASVKKY